MKVNLYIDYKKYIFYFLNYDIYINFMRVYLYIDYKKKYFTFFKL